MPSDKYDDPRPDLAVTVLDEPEGQSADLGGQMTVVYKDWNGEWDFCHLNADGEPWLHSPDHEKWSKDQCIAAAGLAHPAWPVRVVKENPWAAEEPEAA